MKETMRSLLLVITVAFTPVGSGAAEAEREAMPVYHPPAPEQSEAAADSPQYMPPGIGASKNRTSAGTRGAGDAGIELIAPADHIGLTTAAQPTLYWFFSGATTARVEFVLRDEVATKPFVERTLPKPAGAGFQAVSLAELGVSLPIGTDYQWSVSLVADDAHRSRDVVATAWIRRVEPSEALATRLAGDRGRAAFAYAESGIWYDAFRAASEAQRQSLLGQVGLGAIARNGLVGDRPSTAVSAD